MALAVSIMNFKAEAQTKAISLPKIEVNIDLDNVKDDKVQVTVNVPKIKTEKTTFYIPKTVPGTYSTDNYGRYIEDLKAFDTKGNPLPVSKYGNNAWEIDQAQKLTKITYWVNDSYDIPGENELFSPAGTNIDAGKNFVLNTHGFVGYFTEFQSIPYQLNVLHPQTLWGATSMTDANTSNTADSFTASHYAELVENPIMYSKPDYTTFNVGGMDILFAVYSPHGLVTAESMTPALKKMMTAQKAFLGTFNTTKKYSVLLYLSDTSTNDARGYGALEHPTATTVVMPEEMSKDELAEQIKDVVSHEFFHIVTPLNIHSKEIQFFDFNNPKMSKHLWMYEGVTEYFANLFQVNQGLISENDFFDRMIEKIENASTMDDNMPFTKMSENVLVKPYKDQYLNVYQKGALIGMCLDIQLRESSNGKKGILDLMKKLSETYGVNKPFNDDELFAKITELTYPEIGQFLNTYVAGRTKIPYEQYFAKMGVTKASVKIPGNVFIKKQIPYITVDPQTKAIEVQKGIELPEFYKNLDLRGGDVITEINGKKYDLDNIYDMITASESWKDNDPISLKIKRAGKEMTLNGKIKIPMVDSDGYRATDDSKKTLREAWLKG